MTTPLVSLISESIRRLQPYQPGRPISEVARARGIPNVVKLASNENPLGAGERALAALRGLTPQTLAHYPDSSGGALRDAIARRSGLSAENIILGNGSNEVLELAAQLTLHSGAAAVYSRHAFIVYKLAAATRHAKEIIVAAAQGFAHDLPALAAAANSSAVRLMFIANPNNPTGTWHAPAAIRALLQQTPPHVLVVLDEAYHEYTDGGSETLKFLDDFPNLLITRTFSKIHGLAGLRAGYGFAAAEIIELLNRIRQPFNMNIAAQLAAAACLEDTRHIAASIRMNKDGMKTLIATFKKHNIAYIPSHANFLTFRAPQDADTAYNHFLNGGLIIRTLKEYDMPQWLRVTIGSAEQNTRFARLLSELC